MTDAVARRLACVALRQGKVQSLGEDQVDLVVVLAVLAAIAWLRKLCFLSVIWLTD